MHSGRDLANAVVLDEYLRRAGQPVGEDGASAEILVVGNEGLIGVALFMGGEATLSRGHRAERWVRVPVDRAEGQG